MQPKTFLRTLSLIHYALCAGLLLFMIFVYMLNKDFKASLIEGDVFVYVVPVAGMIGYFVSKYSYQNLIRNLQKEESLKTKLLRYKVVSIIQYALIEAPAILALVAYFLNGTIMYLVIAIALLAYLFAQRPSLEKLFREVPLSFDEKKQFDTLKS